MNKNNISIKELIKIKHNYELAIKQAFEFMKENTGNDALDTMIIITITGIAFNRIYEVIDEDFFHIVRKFQEKNMCYDKAKLIGDMRVMINLLLKKEKALLKKENLERMNTNRYKDICERVLYILK